MEQPLSSHDKLVLFDLVNFAPKQPSPTDSWSNGKPEIRYEAMMFAQLQDELEQWLEIGKKADFWWRDDDAQKPTRELEKLLEISDANQTALSLAVIPDGVAISLSETLCDRPRVSVLQHGFSHQNHAPATERKMELGWHRPVAVIDTQIRTGKIILQALFSEQFVPVMVPPWNRIDFRVVKRLQKYELKGLSTLGPRKTSRASGLRQINVHVDIINWRDGRRFAGEQACLEQIVTHLRAKRTGQADIDEPTGIMSHHLVHDASCWGFLEKLFGFLNEHPGAHVSGAASLF